MRASVNFLDNPMGTKKYRSVEDELESLRSSMSI